MVLGKCDMVAVFVPRARALTLLACLNTYTIQGAVAARQGSVHNLTTLLRQRATQSYYIRNFWFV